MAGELRENRALSERRVCKTLGFGRTTVRYRAKKRAEPKRAEERLLELSQEWKRFGYRRLYIMLKREGLRISRDRVAQLCREKGLTIRPRRKPRRKGVVERKPHVKATRPNECWTLDFVSDQLESGKRLRFLNVVDECTRECLMCWPAYSYPSADVVSRLEKLVKQRGQAPARLRSDNGSEFIAVNCQKWLSKYQVEHALSRPGKPTDNAMVESFNSRFRDECLNRYLFGTLWDAAAVAEQYRKTYNERRPHSSLRYKTPLEYRQFIERGA